MPDWPTIHDRKGFYLSSPFLAVFSSLYRLAISIRLAAYKRKNKNILPGFVLSLGNLTVGGTGKTPAATMLAKWAIGEGHRAAIISRGYRNKNKQEIFEVSDGDDIHAGPAEAGDEPYLLAKRLKNVPVIISKNRYEAGLFAHKKFGTDFFILDDGFQHLALARNLNLLLIDGSNPFGNEHLLPWGPLREPLGQITRADAVIITRSKDYLFPGDGKSFLDNIKKNTPVFRAEHTPDDIVFPKENLSYLSSFLKGRRVVAFAGIARPEVFKKTLEELGANVVFFKSFIDHHFYKSRELIALNEKKEELDASCIVTTEKDWVKIEDISSAFTDLAYLTIRFTLSSGQDRFFEMLKQSIKEISVT